MTSDPFGHELKVGDKVWIYRHGREAVGTIERFGGRRAYLRLPGEFNKRSKDGTVSVLVDRCHLAERSEAKA